MSERKWKPWRQWEWDIYGFRCSLSSVAILHFHSYPTTSTVIPSASSTNPNMHFKVSKHGSLLNHNRHFAAHSLFIASINMEKPCLNSPVIGSPLMLTVIMVILVPGITRCPHLSFTTPKNTHRWSYARWNRKWEKNSCHTSTMGAVFVRQQEFVGIYRTDNGPQGHTTTEVGGHIQQSIHTQLLTGKTDFTCPTNLLCNQQ